MNKAEQRKLDHATPREEYEKNPKHCPECNKLIPYEKRENKFCNHSCSVSYTNKGRVSPLSKHNKCKHCGSPILNARTYCDLCVSNGIHNSKVIKLDDAKTPKLRRKILISMRGDKCQECGLTEWRGKKLSIQMHHKDGNSDNNIEENLILLCPNCHSITPNYGSKNKLIGGNTSRNKRKRKYYYTGHWKDV